MPALVQSDPVEAAGLPGLVRTLCELARIERDAAGADVSGGRPRPKQAVADALYVSLSTAGRLIAAARDAGELEPAATGSS
jgi:hypothetical protein